MATSVTAKQSHEAKTDLQVLQSQLSNKQKGMITEDTVEELKRLAADPNYGEEFLDTYRDHLNILSSNSKYTSAGYLSAVKFFSLMEAENSITDAYIIVFPERLLARTRRGQDKASITGEASRYNATALVNEIRKVASIPVQLIHRHLLHEAILGQAELMRSAKSEMVKQKAGEVIIRELKPTEDSVLSIKVEDGSTSVIEELSRVSKELALNQFNSVTAGVPLKDISGARLQQERVIEGEFSKEEAELPLVDVPEEEPAAVPKTKSWVF